MLEDLTPRFPLPARGDDVMVKVPCPAEMDVPRLEWCRVVAVRTGLYDFYPVIVQFGDGRRCGYQQGEIRGWRTPAVPRRRRLTWLFRRRWARRWGGSGR